ncbi:alkaline phosphatase D family protein [Haloferula chungangensis]|uniref:Alkaline phosphatase D family protein n=1 Tax=Haloferula chungangensis TaxID=1048331 RepID=A0ABW2L861_9BACT
MYDWKMDEGAVEVELMRGRLLHLLTHRIDAPEKGLVMEAEVEIVADNEILNPASVWLGFAVGASGLMDDPRHVAVATLKRTNVGLKADGRLMIGKSVSKEALSGKGSAKLKLVVGKDSLELSATRDGKTIMMRSKVSPELIKGNVCLAGESPRTSGHSMGPIRGNFRGWKISGEGFVRSGVAPFGPILWTQYTRQEKKVKLSVQMPPLGEEDDPRVRLEVRKQGGEWMAVGTEEIHSLARTAVFSFELLTADGVWEYRAVYPWKGENHEWTGKLIEDPAVAGRPMRIGVFSCDNGYAFPLPTMTRNVALQDPNLMFFAGDQIYESFGGFQLVRKPVEKAMLDYLRKFYQFGWTWRELMKDRPTIILPDDHDVFQGNLWGSGGRATELDTEGGYVMPAEWVKAVERTQTAHLPDPVDPEPIEQGIGVYFTQMRWGGVPMAILEDRKWKSGPKDVLPENPYGKSAMELDVAGASLLGERQEKFLTEWAEATADEPLRMVISQTILCKATTHGTPEMKKSGYDFDSNGWPQSGRRRALLPLKGDNTVMLHGDQHLGLLVRQGVDDWNDGPWAFMVPGTANGWPRAWWPDKGEITGDFRDPFGNRFSVLAAANPEKGSNLLNPFKTDPPEKTAQLKGSGHGIVEVSADRKTVTFSMFHYLFDAAKPGESDQFEGFPQTLEFGVK